jgi:hypothetical protein
MGGVINEAVPLLSVYEKLRAFFEVYAILLRVVIAIIVGFVAFEVCKMVLCTPHKSVELSSNKYKPGVPVGAVKSETAITDESAVNSM